MIESYPAIYRDRFGEETTTILNDGTTLRMELRGVIFAGEDFNAFEPDPGIDPARLSTFVFKLGWLYDCEIECDIPLPVVIEDETIPGTLHLHLILRPPSRALPGALEETVLLRLTCSDRIFLSSGKSGWFEDELLDLQRQLPSGGYLKSCIACAFSDYSPSGHDIFGDLACFRGRKEEYLAVKNKFALFDLWSSMTGNVQETWLCDEFERRVPGTGYRG